jgi:hypothetical protein
MVRPGRACAENHRVVERVGHGTARALRHRYDRIGCVVSRPRPRSPASSSPRTVTFSVPPRPGRAGSGAVQGDAEGDHTAVLSHPDPVDHERIRSSPVGSMASSSATACSVRATNQRETADLEVPAAYSICIPARRGSGPLITKARKAGRHLIVSSQMAGASGPRLKTYRLCIAAVCAPK